jgi:alkylhydroperoxidase/carboxymuconolactone decarboxylase family protein YurZ
MSEKNIVNFMTDDQLKKLRDAYCLDTMIAASKGALAGMHPGGAEYVNGLVDTLYNPKILASVDRERCLIAVLGSQSDPMTLAVHIYWGLMEGMGEEEVKMTLLLVGGYSGISGYAGGLLTMKACCAALAQIAGTEDCSSGAVLGKLIATFR